MDARDKEKLQRHYSNLLDVMYSSISPHLISNFVITLDMHEEIESRPTEKKKMEKLLTILPSRGDRALKELVNALKPSYGWIARKLENEPVNSRRPAIPINNQRNLPEISIANYLRDVTRILQKNPRVSTHWGFLANSMFLMPTTVMDIKREMSFSGGHEYAIFAVLEAWVTKVGNSRATFSKLIALLEREGMNQSGEAVAEYWTSLSEEYSNNNNISQSEPFRRRDRSRSPVITDV